MIEPLWTTVVKWFQVEELEVVGPNGWNACRYLYCNYVHTVCLFVLKWRYVHGSYTWWGDDLSLRSSSWTIFALSIPHPRTHTHLLFSPSGFHSEFKQVISTVITVGEEASIKKMQVCVYVHMCLSVITMWMCACMCVPKCVITMCVYQSLQCGWRGAVCLSHKRERDQKDWWTSWTFNHTGTTWL